MDLELRGRVFLIAGSSRGIGRAIAGALLAEGACVCITGRDSEPLEAAAADFGQPERVLTYAGDLCDALHVAEVYRAIVARWGTVDGLVANIGNGAGTLGAEQRDDEWHDALQRNLLAAVAVARAAIPHLHRSGGAIVFISSIAGVEAIAAPLAYSAAKAALLSYSKNLARELAPHIRVNSVAPGNVLFAGGSWAQRLAREPERTMAAITAAVPMARFGTPAEIANLVAFLCSQRASFVTGSCFVADGGQTRSI